jgi:hypothetical protein
MIAEEDFYSVLRPHIVEDDREHAGQATRTSNAAVN